MSLSFLLRFEEPVERSRRGDGAAYPQCVTQRGQATPQSLQKMPDYCLHSSESLATATHTRKEREQGDMDYHSPARIIPHDPLMAGEKTKTGVARESADRDRRQHETSAIPKCFSS
jgi:hypothetical protein